MRICREPDAVWGYINAQQPDLLRVTDQPVSEQAKDLNAVSVEQAWAKRLDRRCSDPAGAITSARTMLESVCKTILDDRGIECSDPDDLPKLYRKTSRILGLAPSDHTEEQSRRSWRMHDKSSRNWAACGIAFQTVKGPGRVAHKQAPTMRVLR